MSPASAIRTARKLAQWVALAVLVLWLVPTYAEMLARQDFTPREWGEFARAYGVTALVCFGVLRLIWWSLKAAWGANSRVGRGAAEA